MHVGKVVEVWRYPVKSMGGEAVAQALVDTGGLAGDRHWAVIDGDAREVFLRGERVELTPKEFELLFFLSSRPRRAFSRQELLESVWQSSSEWQQAATVTEHVRKLRAKIEDDPVHPRWLMTVRNLGYRFDP